MQIYQIGVCIYKGSNPRAADTACYARARKILTKGEGCRNNRPMIWCNWLFDIAKSYLCGEDCPVLCCVLVGDVPFRSAVRAILLGAGDANRTAREDNQ